MSAFLFQIELSLMTEEIANTIPEHRKHINKLFSEGRILSYSVSASRDHIWCVVNTEDEKEAMEIIAGFPIRKFFTDVMCYPLLFHNALPATQQSISLN
jgi:hypothetical protein